MNKINEFNKNIILRNLQEFNIFALIYDPEKYSEGCSLFLRDGNFIYPIWVPFKEFYLSGENITSREPDLEQFIALCRKNLTNRIQTIESISKLDKKVSKSHLKKTTDAYFDLISDQFDFFRSYDICTFEYSPHYNSNLEYKIFDLLDNGKTPRETCEFIFAEVGIDSNIVIDNILNYKKG